MKKYIYISCFVFACVLTLQAKDPVIYQTGHLTRMSSVSCAYVENSGKSFVEEFRDGGDAKNKGSLCQEYVLKSDKILFHIRPKEARRATLLPIGEVAKFRIKKDRLMLAIPEIGAKEEEYLVVSMTQILPEEPQSDENVDPAQSGK
jgi:hypothetical protein